MKIAEIATDGRRARAVLHHAAGLGMARRPACRAGADDHTRPRSSCRSRRRCFATHGIDATFVGHPLLDRARDAADRARKRGARLGVRDGPSAARALSGQPAAGDRAPPRSVRRDRARAAAPASGASGRREQGAARHDCRRARVPFRSCHAASFTILRAADAAICKSGTTTLEAAVALCPLVVAYRTDALTYALARRVVQIPYIGLVNVAGGPRDRAASSCRTRVQPVAMADALDPLLDVQTLASARRWSSDLTERASVARRARRGAACGAMALAHGGARGVAWR